MKKMILTLLCSILIYSAQAQFKMVGYLTNWGDMVNEVQQVDFAKVTHINIAFYNPNKFGQFLQTNGLSATIETIHTNNVKVLASLGGATALQGIWLDLMSPPKRSMFIDSIMTFVKKYNFDGVDMDLEGSNINQYYEGFVLQLTDSLHKYNKLHTAAIATWESGTLTNNALQAFDFLNVMTYDACGTWSANPCQHSSYQFAVNDLDFWTNTRGIAKEKLILGVPSYGYYWNTSNNNRGSFSYKEIVGTYDSAQYKDEIFPGTNQYLYYNGIATIRQKTALAYEKAGGMMMWTLQYDSTTNYSCSILRNIYEQLQVTSNNTAPLAQMVTSASTFTEGDTITLEASATDADGTITKISFVCMDNDKSYALGQDLTAPFQVSINGTMGPGTYQVFATAMDNGYASVNSDTITITILAATEQRAYPNDSLVLPGKIEAENFDLGGSGVAYNENSAGNNGGAYRTYSVDIEACADAGGGYNVGWIQSGEWLEYTFYVLKDTTYQLHARVASGLTGTYTLGFDIDGTAPVANMSVTGTGSWQTWKSFSSDTFALDSGKHVLRLRFVSGGYNLNYVSINYPTPVVISSLMEASKNYFSNVIYPNPTSGSITYYYQGNASDIMTIRCYDLSGRLIQTCFSGPINHNETEIPLSFDYLQPGTYVLESEIHGHKKSTLLVKKFDE